MNRGTRMSSALALVTPRVAVNPDAPPDATLPPASREPLLIVAKVPDLRPAGSSTATPTPASRTSWKPSWTLPRPKFRVAYLKIAATLAGLDFATCWTWIVTLPPIVKLGTIVASVVMSIWMFGTGGNDKDAEPAPNSAWHQDDTSLRRHAAAGPAADFATSSTSVPARRSEPSGVAISTDEVPQFARESSSGDGPTIREIQDAARGRSTGSNFDDGWPRVAQRDGTVASATVRPIAPHKEPYASAPPYDHSPRGTYADDVQPRGAAFDSKPVDASPMDGALQPPSDMPRRWAERPQPTESAAYPPVQTNPHYAETVVAPTPTQTLDNRTLDNRPLGDRAHSDGRSADSRIAGNRDAPQPTSEQLEAERRAYENNRRRAYEFSRDRAQAERQPLPETYRR